MGCAALLLALSAAPAFAQAPCPAARGRDRPVEQPPDAGGDAREARRDASAARQDAAAGAYAAAARKERQAQLDAYDAGAKPRPAGVGGCE
jgi:hypothetical protein